MPLYPSPGAYDLLAEQLIEGSVDGVLVFDREQRYLVWNPALERLLGIRADRAIGYCASDVFPQFAKSGMDRHYAAALAGEEVILACQPFQMPETGRLCYANVRYMPLANRYGFVTAVLGLVHDVTKELHEQDERVRVEAQRAFGVELADPPPPADPPDPSDQSEVPEYPLAAANDLLVTTAHELGPPIDAILSYVELLTRGASGPITPEQDDQLGRIATSARHLCVVANRMLDIAASGVDSGTDQPAGESRRRRISASVAAAITIVAPRAMARDVKLSSGVNEETDVWYYGDADWVTRIVVNLLSNAVKFTPAGGRVVIFAGEGVQAQGYGASTARRAYIRVDDTGIGIAPEQLEAVFEPFVHGPSLDSPVRGLASHGTGLGLTISRRLARQMGGDVLAISTPNTGSQFTLWLPAEEPAAVQQESQHTTLSIVPPSARRQGHAAASARSVAHG